jgi:integrase
VALKFTKLDRASLKALAPGETAHEHGMVARRERDGDLRWSVNLMVDGERIHRVVGRESEGVTRHQAEQLVETLRTRAREQRLDLPQGRKLHRAFAEAAEEYITRMEESGGKDMANKKRHLRSYLVPAFGTFRLDQLTEFELRKYRKRRVTSGASDATVNREFATLMHFLNRAASKDWRWIKPEDRPTIPKVQEERKKRRALTADERTALMKAAAEDHDPRLWLFVALGLGCGMRHTEILRRRYDEIDWGINRFEIDKAKAGGRYQPFPAWVREALLRQQAMEADPNGWIFPTERPTLCKKPYRTTMDEGFRRAAKRAGLDPSKVTPHLMRHTLITDLSRTVDDATIQKISGHKTPAMIRHYTHVNDERVDLALSAIDTALVGVITPKLHTARSGDEKGPKQSPQVSAVKTAA